MGRQPPCPAGQVPDWQRRLGGPVCLLWGHHPGPGAAFGRAAAHRVCGVDLGPDCLPVRGRPDERHLAEQARAVDHDAGGPGAGHAQPGGRPRLTDCPRPYREDNAGETKIGACPERTAASRLVHYGQSGGSHEGSFPPRADCPCERSSCK